MPDYNNIELSSIMVDLETDMQVKELFYSKVDWLKNHLRHYKPYYIKWIGQDKQPRMDYVCPRTNVFGLKLYGERGCSYCKHCTAIYKITPSVKDSYKVYCCHPRQVRELDNSFEGYECDNAKFF